MVSVPGALTCAVLNAMDRSAFRADARRRSSRAGATTSIATPGCRSRRGACAAQYERRHRSAHALVVDAVAAHAARRAARRPRTRRAQGARDGAGRRRRASASSRTIYPEELVLAAARDAPRGAREVDRDPPRAPDRHRARARAMGTTIELAARRDGTILGARAPRCSRTSGPTREASGCCVPRSPPAILPGPYRVPELSPAACAWRSPRRRRRRAYRGAGHAGGRLRHRSGPWIDLARELRPGPGRRPPAKLHPARRVPLGRRAPARPRFRSSTTAGTTRGRSTPRSPWRRLPGATARASRRARAGARAGASSASDVASYVLLTGLGPYEGAMLRDRCDRDRRCSSPARRRTARERPPRWRRSSPTSWACSRPTSACSTATPR